MGIGALCDCLVWYYAKDMKIYDDDFSVGTELKVIGPEMRTKKIENHDRQQNINFK